MISNIELFNLILILIYHLSMSLIAVVVSSYATSKVLFQYNNPSIKTKIGDDAQMVVSKAKNLRSKIGEREKLISDYGIWFLLRGG